MKNKNLLVLASILTIGLCASCKSNTSSSTTTNTNQTSQTESSEKTSKTSKNDSTSKNPVTVLGVTISGAVESLAKGESATLKATVTLSEGEDTLGVTWTCDNENAATIDNGLLTALSVKEDTVVTIQAKSKKDNTKSASVKVKILKDENVSYFGQKEKMTFGEKDSLTPDKMVYWASKQVEWAGGVSTINEENTYTENNTFAIDFTATAGIKFYGTQLFYKNSSLKTGNPYKLTLKVNSEDDGDITLNNKVVSIKKGENNISVSYIEGATSIDIQFGVTDISSVLKMKATFEITEWKDISEERTPFEAPTNVKVTPKENEQGIYTLTFDAVEGAPGYMYTIYQGETQLESFKYKSCTSGDTLDLRNLETGTYSLAVQAVGNGLDKLDSAESDKVTINHTKPSEITAKTYHANFGDNVSNLVFGEEEKVTSNAPIYWNDQGWCGSNVNVKFAVAKADQIQFKYEGATITYGFQIFQKNTELISGNKYTLKLNLFTDTAGAITINDKEVTLTVGDNPIQVEYVANRTANGICLQNNKIQAAKMKLSNIRWTEVIDNVEDKDKVTSAEEPADLVEEKTEIGKPIGVVYNTNGTLAWANVDGATSYKATVYQDEACTIKTSIDGVTVTNGGGLDTSSLEEGTYYVKIFAVASDGTVSEGSDPVVINLTSSLPAPVGVVYNKGESTLAWANVNGAVSYKATVYQDEACTIKTSIENVEITNGGKLDVSSLEEGTYYVKVFAVASNGKVSEGSAAVKIDLTSVTPTPTPTPSEGNVTVLANGASATRIEGAGAWIWVQNDYNITPEAKVTGTVTMKNDAGVDVNASINEIFVSDFVSNYFRVYAVLNIPPVDNWETTINFVITAGENSYSGTASFTGSAYNA